MQDAFTRYAAEVSPKKSKPEWEVKRLAAFSRDFPHLTGLRLADFDTPHLAEWRDARLKVVQAATVHRDFSLLRNVLTVARDEWKWMTHNPVKGLSLPEYGIPRDRRVDPWKEVRPLVRVLGYVTGKAPQTKQQETALAFLVGLRSAMRAGEILQLGKASLDLTKRLATVKHKTQHLTGRPRVVPLTRQACRLLRPVAHLEHCFTVKPPSLDALFRKHRDRLLLNDLHFHDSRGEALTRLSKRVDVMTLAKISGHRDLGVLLNTYYRETAEQIAARL